MKNIAIFASGTGSNAKKIIVHFKDHAQIKVALIVSNKKTAPVLDLAKTHDIPSLVINRPLFYKSKDILKIFNGYNIDFVVLAGFLWLIPKYLVQAFEQRIINIHPALLPKFGGKGMYGMNVHRAVKAANESESGISIHFVNENYDEGNIIFQASCPITSENSPEEIAQKVLRLEHLYYPNVIERLLL